MRYRIPDNGIDNQDIQSLWQSSLPATAPDQENPQSATVSGYNKPSRPLH